MGMEIGGVTNAVQATPAAAGAEPNAAAWQQAQPAAAGAPAGAPQSITQQGEALMGQMLAQMLKTQMDNIEDASDKT